MQPFPGYNSQLGTSTFTVQNPYHPSTSSPLHARYTYHESPDMDCPSDSDFSADAPTSSTAADYPRTRPSQHRYKSSHGSFHRIDSDTSSFQSHQSHQSHHSHQSHSPQHLHLSSSPSRLQTTYASLSPDDNAECSSAAYEPAGGFYTPEHLTPDFAVRNAQSAFGTDVAPDRSEFPFRQPVREPDYSRDFPYDFSANYSRDYPSDYSNYPRDYPSDYPRDYPNYPSNYPNYPRDYPQDYPYSDYPPNRTAAYNGTYRPDYDRGRFDSPVFRRLERIRSDPPARTPIPPIPAKTPTPPPTPADVRERVEQAQRWCREGRAQEALEALQQLQQAYPAELLVRLELARVQADLGCFREACEVLREAYRQSGAWSEQATERLVRLEERVGDRAGIERVMRSLLRADNYRGVKTIMECGLHVAKLGGSFATQQVFEQLQAEGAVTQGNLVMFQVQFLARFVSLSQATHYLQTCVQEYPKHGPLWFFFFTHLENQEMMLWDGSDMPARIRAHELISAMVNAVQCLSVELRWKVFYVAIQTLLRSVVHLRLVVQRHTDRLAEYRSNTALGLRACSWYFHALLLLCPPNLRWKCWLLAGRAHMLAGDRRTAKAVEER